MTDQERIKSLTLENEYLRETLNKVGLYIEAACHGHTRADEPLSLSPRLNMVRKLAVELQPNPVIRED
jgi:hypothetical protein